jgi:hypothetical protein
MHPCRNKERKTRVKFRRLKTSPHNASTSSKTRTSSRVSRGNGTNGPTGNILMRVGLLGIGEVYF